MEENNTPDIFAIKPETIWLPQEITDGAKAVKKARNMIADHLFNDKKGVNPSPMDMRYLQSYRGNPIPAGGTEVFIVAR